MSTPTARYVALEGLQHGNRFYTSHSEGNDPTKSAQGETWYRVLGYANTPEEAFAIIYPTEADYIRAENDYIRNILSKLKL
jgi:hypothetical protein